MDKKEILKEFVNYCKDTGGNTKSKKDKIKFSSDLIIFLYNNKKITIEEIEETQKNILNILKYNTLKIEKLKNTGVL